MNGGDKRGVVGEFDFVCFWECVPIQAFQQTVLQPFEQ